MTYTWDGAKSWQSGQAGHIAEHNALHRRLASEYHTSDYGHDVQTTINAALGHDPKAASSHIGMNKRVIIDPGEYIITQPIRIYSALRLTVWAHGAEIIPTGAHDAAFAGAALDLCGVVQSAFYGLHIHTATGSTINRGIWLRTNQDISPLKSTTNQFYSTHVQGDFVHGVYIGDVPESVYHGYQCDFTGWFGLGIVGAWSALVASLNECGLYVGSGANNTNHTFVQVGVNQTKTALTPGHNCLIRGASINVCDTVCATRSAGLSIDGLRAEHARKLLEIGPAAGFPVAQDFRNFRFAANNLDADGVWASFDMPGNIQLSNFFIYAVGDQKTPQISAQPIYGQSLTINGLMISGAKSSVSNVIQVNVNVAPRLTGYYKLTDFNGFASGVSETMLRSPNGAWHKIGVSDAGAVTATPVVAAD